ncbi:Hypothetical predicted protein [Podarcis lilfordi]|uniref:Uncharacterized protein n=1 Tax=Podarcis lilfordi TaxID=74358 RepID=A0AA35KK83_9SAUR|nr:Hypothetical predicted protein [Podarcis lilfordi]
MYIGRFSTNWIGIAGRVSGTVNLCVNARASSIYFNGRTEQLKQDAHEAYGKLGLSLNIQKNQSAAPTSTKQPLCSATNPTQWCNVGKLSITFPTWPVTFLQGPTLMLKSSIA